MSLKNWLLKHGEGVKDIGAELLHGKEVLGPAGNHFLNKNPFRKAGMEAHPTRRSSAVKAGGLDQLLGGLPSNVFEAGTAAARAGIKHPLLAAGAGVGGAGLGYMAGGGAEEDTDKSADELEMLKKMGL